MGDIVLVEGTNELNAQLVPIAPVLANLYGTVTDGDTGQGIAGVRVTTTGAITESDSNGDYTILDLTPGNYTVQFAKDGFETKEVNVSAQEGNNELNIQLVPIAPVGVEVTSITVSPTSLTSAKHEYETSLGLGFWGDPFTISITFSNPFDHDVWVRPDYAFGHLTGEPLGYVAGSLQGFTAEELLYFRLLLNTAYMQGDYSYTTDWQKPWDPRGENKGSNMVLGIYDPDGAPRLIGAADYWLKIPPKGSITTVKEGHLGSDLQVKALQCVLCGEIITGGVEEHYASNHPGVEITCWSWGGLSGCYFDDGSGSAVNQVYVPAEGVVGPYDLCVVALKVWSLVYDPGYGQQRVGNQWVTVNWRPVELEPVAAAVPDMINITPI